MPGRLEIADDGEVQIDPTTHERLGRRIYRLLPSPASLMVGVDEQCDTNIFPGDLLLKNFDRRIRLGGPTQRFGPAQFSGMMVRTVLRNLLVGLHGQFVLP